VGGRLYVGPHRAALAVCGAHPSMRSDTRHRCVCMRPGPAGSHCTAIVRRARDVRVCMRTSPTGPSRTYSIHFVCSLDIKYAHVGLVGNFPHL
jgi:hypothetical protein